SAGGPGLRIPGMATVAGWIDSTGGAYHRSLHWVLRHQRATLIVTFVTLALTLLLYVLVPKGFLPLQDTGSIVAVTEAGPDVSFIEMQARQTEISNAIRGDADVLNVVSVVGSGSVNPTPNVGRIVVTLRARDEKRDGVDAVLDRLKQR